jgi:hypothetical protein
LGEGSNIDADEKSNLDVEQFKVIALKVEG